MGGLNLGNPIDFGITGDEKSQFSPMNNDNVGLKALGKASSQQPTPIDYKGLIQEQADVNRVNSSNPFGASTWNKNKTQLRNTFSPGMKNLFKQQVGQAGQGFDTNNFNDQIQNATFTRAMNLLQPGMDQQNRDFQQSMADRGLPSGGKAYDNEFANVQRAQNSAKENAALSAVLAGNDAALRGRGQNLAERGQQFSERGSLLSQAPGANPTALDVVGPAGMAMNQALAGQQQRSNQKSSNTNAGAGLGAAMLMA
jgi:hypothetical protein